MSVVNVPLFLFVLSCHEINGYILTTTLSIDHEPTEIIDDSDNSIFKHSKENRFSYESTLHSTKSLPKNSFERKMNKLHNLSDAVVRTLENSERNGYISKLTSTKSKNKVTKPMKHLINGTRKHNHIHSRKNHKKSFEEHTRQLHRMMDKIFEMLQNNEKKYYESKINDLTHRLINCKKR